MKIDIIDCLAYLFFISIIIFMIRPVGEMRDNFSFGFAGVSMIILSVVSMMIYYMERKEERKEEKAEETKEKEMKNGEKDKSIISSA